MTAALLLACLLQEPAAAPAAAPRAPEGTYGPPANHISDAALPKVVAGAIDGARDWLVAHQNPDGSFGSHHSPRWYEVLADVPGSHEAFLVATSALCVMALDQCARPDDAARAAANRGIDFLLAHKRVKRPNGMEFYNTWAFGYGMQALGEWLLRHPDDPRKEEILGACREMLERLPGYQVLDGGFSYLDFDLQSYPPSWSSTSFTTATVLVGVERVKRLGLVLPEGLVDKAVARVAEDQTPEGSFLYGHYLWEMPRRGINEPKGSACRTPGNLYALDLFGKMPHRGRPMAGTAAEADVAAAASGAKTANSTEEAKGAKAADRELAAKGRGAYVEAVENLCIKYVGFQQIAVRRPIPHEAWYNISGYFYLYGFYYASLVLAEKLPEAEQKRLFPHLARGVLYCRQPDGSFWDYPLYDYHNSYGTAFALLSLSRAPKEWLPVP